jgi:2-oxoglutarate dehydrogenase E2 component (dihydrolipoamide succinyltransferase)
MTTAGEPAPAAAPAPAPNPQPAPVSAAPPAASAAPATPTEPHVGEPGWLPERLKRAEEAARSAVLKELGITDPAQAKAALDAARAAEEAQKTQAQKDAERIAALTQSSARVAELEAIAKGRAEYEMAKLSDSQKAAVTALAGNDPGAQLKAITALAPTWGQSAAPVPPSAPPAAPVVPASSTPAGAAPAPAQISGTDHKARYADLQKTNPVAAAHYLTAHQKDIYPTP